MSYVSERVIPSRETRTKTIYVLKCDECGILFEKSGVKYRHRNYHFHSNECVNKSQSTGVLKKKKEDQFMEKLGVKNPAQDPKVKAKTKNTNIQIYGVDNPAKSPKVKAKTENTNFERYGTKHTASKGSLVRDKIEATTEKRFGCKSSFGNKDVQTKSRNTLAERYDGYENYLKNVVRKGIEEKHGVKNAYNIPEIKARANSPQAKAKRYKTKKDRGLLRESYLERNMVALLREIFGETDVQTHVFVNGHDVDAYVKSIDVYIEFDGAFWHGPDFPQKVRFDIEQNKWFKAQNMKLVRVNEIEWKKASDKRQFLTHLLRDQ